MALAFPMSCMLGGEILATIEMTISGTFRCPRPLKVSFKVNKGNKFGDFGDSPQYRVST